MKVSACMSLVSFLTHSSWDWVCTSCSFIRQTGGYKNWKPTKKRLSSLFPSISIRRNTFVLGNAVALA